MFQGFSPETVDFLWGLRFNNNREWFLPHKQDYVTYLYEPMKELGQALFASLGERPGHVLKVSRIYRDARLHYPQPYKDGLWLCIRRDCPTMTENPSLYFSITADGISCGFGFWRPKSPVMAALRRDMAADPERFIRLLRDTQQATGLPVTARSYQRPRKDTPCPELAPYFSWRDNISCGMELPFSPEVFSPELADRVALLFRQLLPLYDYFNRLLPGPVNS